MLSDKSISSSQFEGLLKEAALHAGVIMRNTFSSGDTFPIDSMKKKNNFQLDHIIFVLEFKIYQFRKKANCFDEIIENELFRYLTKILSCQIKNASKFHISIELSHFKKEINFCQHWRISF